MLHEIPTKRYISCAKAILAERYFLTPVQKFGLDRVAAGDTAPPYVFDWLDRCLKTGDV